MADASHWRMKPVVALVAAALLSVPAAAHAGGYVALGVGSAADTGGDLRGFSSDGHMSGRLMLGQRISIVSFEAGLAGYGLEPRSGGRDYNAQSLGAALKLNLPLVAGLEGYGRAGVERTWLGTSGDQMAYSGNGYVVGGGLEYGFELPLTRLSVWFDWTRHGADLVPDGRGQTLDAQADLWTLGLSVAL